MVDRRSAEEDEDGDEVEVSTVDTVSLRAEIFLDAALSMLTVN